MLSFDNIQSYLFFKCSHLEVSSAFHLIWSSKNVSVCCQRSLWDLSTSVIIFPCKYIWQLATTQVPLSQARQTPSFIFQFPAHDSAPKFKGNLKRLNSKLAKWEIPVIQGNLIRNETSLCCFCMVQFLDFFSFNNSVIYLKVRVTVRKNEIDRPSIWFLTP